MKTGSLLVVLGLFIIISNTFGQSNKDTLVLTENEDLGLDLITLDKKKEEPKKKKIKQKKNVFWGIKAKKGFTKVGSGARQTIETFYYLKEYTEPNDYVRNVYWYDLKKKKLSQSLTFDKATTRLLHGPYKKLIGGKLVEEGFYYMGAKQGRWEQYNANYTLMEKVKYHRGWPKDAHITYYDPAKTKIKEVVPVEAGVKKGDYYSFYEEGQLMEEGKYDNNIRVGKWTEYFQYRRRKKKEVQYSPDPFDKDFEPYVLKEWDDKGKLIYDLEAEEKKNTTKN